VKSEIKPYVKSNTNRKKIPLDIALTRSCRVIESEIGKNIGHKE
jgi:hypothetical protein